MSKLLLLYVYGHFTFALKVSPSDVSDTGELDEIECLRLNGEIRWNSKLLCFTFLIQLLLRQSYFNNTDRAIEIRVLLFSLYSRLWFEFNCNDTVYAIELKRHVSLI